MSESLCRTQKPLPQAARSSENFFKPKRNRSQSATKLDSDTDAVRSAVVRPAKEERVSVAYDGIMIFIISQEYALNNLLDSKFPNLHLVNMTIHVQILTLNVDH